MSDRERWIVYPLLFLALGLNLRDKITGTLRRLVLLDGKAAALDFENGVLRVPRIDADVVHCHHVDIRDPQGKPLVQLKGLEVPTGEGVKKNSGAVSIHGQDGREIIVLRAHHALRGEFVQQQSDGEPVKLVFKVTEVREDGGLLEIYNGEKTLSLVLAHHLYESGLFARNSARQLARLSRVIQRPKAEPATDRSSDSGTATETGGSTTAEAPPTVAGQP